MIMQINSTPTQRMQYRHEWMITFSDEVIRLQSSHKGQIDWIAAQLLFNKKMNPLDAAVQYILDRSN